MQKNKKKNNNMSITKEQFAELLTGAGAQVEPYAQDWTSETKRADFTEDQLTPEGIKQWVDTFNIKKAHIRAFSLSFPRMAKGEKYTAFDTKTMQLVEHTAKEDYQAKYMVLGLFQQ